MTSPMPARINVTLTMLPSTVNLNLYGGDDFMLRVDVNDAYGEPLDLTGTDPQAHVRQQVTDADVWTEFAALAEESSLFLGLAGKQTIMLPARSVWDVNIIVEGRQVTLAAGVITVTPGVTRRNGA